MAGGEADNAENLFSWLSCLLVSRLLSSWHLEQTPHCAAFRSGRVLGRLQPFQASGWTAAPCKLCLRGLLPVPVTCLAGLGGGKSCWYHCVLGWGVWVWSSCSRKEGFLQFLRLPSSSGKAAAAARAQTLHVELLLALGAVGCGHAAALPAPGKSSLCSGRRGAGCRAVNLPSAGGGPSCDCPTPPGWGKAEITP